MGKPWITNLPSAVGAGGEAVAPHLAAQVTIGRRAVLQLPLIEGGGDPDLGVGDGLVRFIHDDAGKRRWRGEDKTFLGQVLGRIPVLRSTRARDRAFARAATVEPGEIWSANAPSVPVVTRCFASMSGAENGRPPLPYW